MEWMSREASGACPITIKEGYSSLCIGTCMDASASSYSMLSEEITLRVKQGPGLSEVIE